ncbi:MAG: IS110 family transposase [bacterium]|nr:IS110 family transposase [bacterium]
MKMIKYIGLDVHKKSISVAIADEGSNSEIRSYGKIPNTMTAINKLIRKLVSSGNELKFVYEAGPCGYCLYRNLKQIGYDCIVIAPSLTPRKPGERVKTDRRDAETLARLFRANELTPIHVQNSEDKAMRDLVRARKDAKNSEKKTKQILGWFFVTKWICFYWKIFMAKSSF